MKDPVEIRAANQYQAYVKGWSCGARSGMKDVCMETHFDNDIRAAYELGYVDGLRSRAMALSSASKRYRHNPSILRETA